MYIKVNNHMYPLSEANTTLADLMNVFCVGGSDFIALVNGTAAKGHRLLKRGDEIFFVSKTDFVDKETWQAMMRTRYTPEIYEKISAARVGIAGLGGLGSNIAIMLGRAGVGHLHLIDFDKVDVSNLNRQHYTIAQLGMYKTVATAQNIRAVNPYIALREDTATVDATNIDTLFLKDDIICEAFDDAQSKALLVNTLLEKQPQKKIIAASGMAGYESSNTIQTNKITDHFYLCGDKITEAKEGCSLMAPRVMICAAHQANMALRLILDKKET